MNPRDPRRSARRANCVVSDQTPGAAGWPERRFSRRRTRS